MSYSTPPKRSLLSIKVNQLELLDEEEYEIIKKMMETSRLLERFLEVIRDSTGHLLEQAELKKN